MRIRCIQEALTAIEKFNITDDIGTGKFNMIGTH